MRQRNDLNARICACPLDLPGATKRFIRKNRPQLAIFMEAEFWPNLLAAASQEGLKLFLANARLGRKNAKRYSYVAPLMREMAGRFDIITAQSKADAKRLFFFGAKRVITTGNLKFDRAVNDRAVNIGRQWREDIKQDEKAIVLLAGTRPGEEKLLLDAMDNNFFAACFVILRRAIRNAPMKLHRYWKKSVCVTPDAAKKKTFAPPMKACIWPTHWRNGIFLRLLRHRFDLRQLYALRRTKPH